MSGAGSLGKCKFDVLGVIQVPLGVLVLAVLNLISFPEKAATQLESPTPSITILFLLRDLFCTKRASWTSPESKKAKRNLLDRESNPGLLEGVSL
jgi:hypothetical protein